MLEIKTMIHCLNMVLDSLISIYWPDKALMFNSIKAESMDTEF